MSQLLFLSLPLLHVQGLVNDAHRRNASTPGLRIAGAQPVAQLARATAQQSHSRAFTFDGGLLEYVKRWRDLDISPPSSGVSQPVPLSRSLRSEPTVPCPVFSFGPNKQALADRMKAGPVHAEEAAYESSRTLDGQPRHLFISGPAYGGTTALYSLISTSPAVSNLCGAQSLNCEGSWLLIQEGLMPYETRWDPMYPQDWNEALGVFKRYWNLSQPILAEKSPNSALKFTQIWGDLQRTGERASFLYIVRSPCYPPHSTVWEDHMDGIVEQVNMLRAAGARVLVIRLEELLIDPYGVAEDLLEFMPRLGSLDPARAGLGHAPMVEEGDERSIPVANFTEAHSPFWFGTSATTNATLSTSPEVARDMAELGYAGAFSIAVPSTAT